LALAVNRALGRRGKVVGDRYHARALTTPRHMRATCCSTSASTSAPLRASIRGARVRTSRAGITPRLPAMSRRPRHFRRPGWRASDGGARAGRCGWKNTRLPRHDRTQLESADVAPTEHPAGAGESAARGM
jgi:hypothetical protein